MIWNSFNRKTSKIKIGTQIQFPREKSGKQEKDKTKKRRNVFKKGRILPTTIQAQYVPKSGKNIFFQHSLHSENTFLENHGSDLHENNSKNEGVAPLKNLCHLGVYLQNCFPHLILWERNSQILNINPISSLNRNKIV